ncbi:DUF5914 domain-containing protein [Phaeacidiphilus oryzae]|uniref:DUF5914 domain-containing protein n=1 Tax=Phaeacidiphilus oryzae TaxID=348818 RepID=UPI00056056DB|nr:DUF5914 domain-containing protein [Phaeacidiphilus oryzae]
MRSLPLSRRRGRTRWQDQPPTWRQASRALIARALERCTARPSGNWYVLAPSRELRPDGPPLGRTIADQEVVAWRGPNGAVLAGPGACPHLGAPLKDARTACGTLLCHWHGLRLTGRPHAGWRPFPAHDDGVLLWVRLDGAGGEAPTAAPYLPERPPPGEGVAAVYTVEGRCEPEDVVANRLDPWHGAWFHPYSFVDLTVRPPAGDGDVLDVDVAFKVAGGLVVPVRARFTAPEPRTVVMRITEGEGTGSVVETHAVPVRRSATAPRTAVVEAVIASSGRRGFAAARRAAPVLRAVLRATAARLWRDDLAYAERRWQLRAEGRFPGGGPLP